MPPSTALSGLRVLLVSTYELGRQPFGLASPAAWLRAEGAHVSCADLAVEELDESVAARADMVAFYVPMHTATRLATTILARVRRVNPRAHICFYGLYAPLNEDYLRRLGAATILGGEFEQGLLDLAHRLARGPGSGPQREPLVSLRRQAFRVPDRRGLPAPNRYARLRTAGDEKLTGYTEATRGCKHTCRHCPIVPVYGGRFRVVQRSVVLEDIARQVDAGARHITFGDPDFLNAPGHALRLVEELHRRWPDVTYDVTIKVEHLLDHARILPRFTATGCVLVISAIESVDDEVLSILNKGHTRRDFFDVVELCRETGLPLSPTFVTFTPWTTLEGYRELLGLIWDLGLVDSVGPVQYAIRLLIPAGSLLLELPEVQTLVDGFDARSLCHPWRHRDPRVDDLHADVLAAVREDADDRRRVFERVWTLANEACGTPVGLSPAPARVTVPYLTEPWYC
jgi:radical SAM superfamily enzyme YgiQ (UPF0313 family)